MLGTLTLSSDSRTTAGILLLTILAVEYGGLTVLRIVRGHQPATEFQKAFARAGHAHAGVFVIFVLVAQIFADAAHLTGVGNLVAKACRGRGRFWWEALAIAPFSLEVLEQRSAKSIIGGDACPGRRDRHRRLPGRRRPPLR
jgi:hypothetical protein